MMKISSLYTMIWTAYYDDERIMNKVMMLLSFDYHEINALFIQKIIKKIEEHDILMHFRSITVRFNFFKNFISTAFEKFED